jgi:hypothetical protein
MCGPKNTPPKFQPSIRSKSARIKTMADKEHSLNHRNCTAQPSFLFEQTYFKLKAEILVVSFWDFITQLSIFS